MIYAILFAVVVLAFLLFSKKTNDTFYESGMELASQIDVLDFMKRDFSSLHTTSDKAIFHYLINRPWRDSNNWFHSILEMNATDDEEHNGFANDMREAMLGDSQIELASKLMPIPNEVRKHRPSDYAEWSKLHTSTSKSHPHLSIVRFVSASSVMAARACVKAINH